MHTNCIFKKMLLLTAAAASGFFMEMPVMAAAAGVEVNEKNFSDVALRDQAAVFDENKDGILSSEELAKVESITIRKFLDPDDTEEQVPDYQESDFTFDFKGIEYFTSLKELEINLSGGLVDDGGSGIHYDSVISNFSKVYELEELTSFTFHSAKQKKVDLSRLPKLEKADLSLSELQSLTINNKKLRIIHVWDKENASKMKTLDFRNAPNLKTVYLVNLQTKNVLFGKKNKKLKQLFVTSNRKAKINKLELTPLKALKQVALTDVNIKSVDFSKNSALEDIYVDRCTMKKLDLSKNKKLTWVACEGNKTKSIIIPKKNLISTFKWVNANCSKFDDSRLNKKTLTSVILFGNKIKTLDLRRFKKLDYVMVDKNVKVKLAPELKNKQIVRYG